jgi:molecular chaperone GrpE
MTGKKHSGNLETGSAASEPTSDEADKAAQMAAPIIDGSASQVTEDGVLLQKLEQAQARSAENLDGWQRALADFQNYKKRVERDREGDQAAMKSDMIKKVLPILDDLGRALQNRPTEDAWTDGIELIRRKLESILEAEGVKRIEAEGAFFDPNFHEAISQEPVAGAETGRILEVLQHGYVLGDRVIRPAQVRVAA